MYVLHCKPHTNCLGDRTAQSGQNVQQVLRHTTILRSETLFINLHWIFIEKQNNYYQAQTIMQITTTHYRLRTLVKKKKKKTIITNHIKTGVAVSLELFKKNKHY